MPRRRGGVHDYNLTADINVTSLVDVAFTLLVIFLITAPILQSGAQPERPQTSAEAVGGLGDGAVSDRGGRPLVMSPPPDHRGRPWRPSMSF